jgi:hypothetical protein
VAARTLARRAEEMITNLAQLSVPNPHGVVSEFVQEFQDICHGIMISLLILYSKLPTL